VALLLFPLQRGTNLGTYVRRSWPAAWPLGLGILALLWYNQARFGSPFEFGQRYQLWGMEERTVSHFSLGYVPFNLRLYLISIPELSPYFPFVRTTLATEFPPGYIDTEEMHGVLFAMPALLLGFCAWRNPAARTPGTSLRPVIAAGAMASVLAAAVLFCFAGACSRYIVELLAGWTIVVGVGTLAFWNEPGSRQWWRLAVVVAIVWSIVYIWLASFEFRAFARRTQPRLYHVLAHTLDYPSEWFTQHQHVQFGPVLFEVKLLPSDRGATVLAAAGRHGEVNQLIIERKDVSHVVLKVMANLVAIIETPPLAVTGDTLPVVLDAPWLYPPTDHPYWDHIRDPIERRQRQQQYVLIAAQYRFKQQTEWHFDPIRFDPIVQTAPTDGAVAFVTRWQRVELSSDAR
jgi:hypothetical protein